MARTGGFGMTNEEAINELRHQEKLRSKGINYQVDNLVISTAICALEKGQRFITAQTVRTS